MEAVSQLGADCELVSVTLNRWHIQAYVDRNREGMIHGSSHCFSAHVKRDVEADDVLQILNTVLKIIVLL